MSLFFARASQSHLYPCCLHYHQNDLQRTLSHRNGHSPRVSLHRDLLIIFSPGAAGDWDSGTGGGATAAGDWDSGAAAGGDDFGATNGDFGGASGANGGGGGGDDFTCRR